MTKPKELSNKELIKAVKEYYRYHDGKKVTVKDLLVNKYDSRDKVLLVHFTDVTDNTEMSSLAYYYTGGSGEYIISEDCWCEREFEHCLVCSFVNYDYA